MFANMTDDVTFQVMGSHKLAQRIYKGKEDITQNLLMVTLPLFDDNGIKTEVQCMAAEGDVVFLQFSGKAMTRKGQRYENDFIQVFRFRDGKICSIAEYLDTALLASILS